MHKALSLVDKLFRRKLLATTYPESPECLDKIRELTREPTTLYAGFDATSDSLHVGNLAVLMNLVHFYKHGHRVIVLIGDSTAQIGDPSGHSSDRKVIVHDQVMHNAQAIEEQVKRIFYNLKEMPGFDTKILQQPLYVRNSFWYKNANVVDFVGCIFRQVRVGSLLHRKSIGERLASHKGMNMSEFTYQIFQAYDWYHLYKSYDCKFQVGGSDQAGNIYSGHDLIKKQSGNTESFGLLVPLIVAASGKKIGKSTEDLDSNTWLDPEKTTPLKFYQKFVRTPDLYVEKFLNIYSLYEEDEIKEMISTHLKKKPDIWYCQKKLAENACRMVHGSESVKFQI